MAARMADAARDFITRGPEIARMSKSRASAPMERHIAEGIVKAQERVGTLLTHHHEGIPAEGVTMSPEMVAGGWPLFSAAETFAPRQLRDVRRQPPRLVLAQGRHARHAGAVVPEVAEGEFLAVGVLDPVAIVVFALGPGRAETAGHAICSADVLLSVESRSSNGVGVDRAAVEPEPLSENTKALCPICGGPLAAQTATVEYAAQLADGLIHGTRRTIVGVCTLHGRQPANLPGHHSTATEARMRGLFPRGAWRAVRDQLVGPERRRFVDAMHGRHIPTDEERVPPEWTRLRTSASVAPPSRSGSRCGDL
jgi:hypothetical protein